MLSLLLLLLPHPVFTLPLQLARNNGTNVPGVVVIRTSTTEIPSPSFLLVIPRIMGSQFLHELPQQANLGFDEIVFGKYTLQSVHPVNMADER